MEQHGADEQKLINIPDNMNEKKFKCFVFSFPFRQRDPAVNAPHSGPKSVNSWKKTLNSE